MDVVVVVVPVPGTGMIEEEVEPVLLINSNILYHSISSSRLTFIS